MASPITLDLTTIAPVRARIAQWRETRTHRGAPMPATLWAAAVDLARQHGLAPTARALRLDYGTLKRRLAAAGLGRALATATFVDLSRAVRPGLGRCVIAVEGTRGRRLRVEVADLPGADLVALLQTAWGEVR